MDAVARLHGNPLQRLHEELDRHLRVEGQRARHHLVEDDAQSIEIAERRRRLPVDVLGRDVAGRPEALLGEGDGRGVDDLRDPEVGELREVRAVARQQEHVLGLQIAMDDPQLVRAAQRRGDLQRHADRADHLEATRRERRLQGLALDVLHHQEHQPAVFAEVGDLDDVRVVDPVDGARLAQEPLPVRDVHAEILAQDLDGAQALDHHVPREVDDGHAPAPQAPHQAIAGGERTADERIRVARERRPVERAEPRVVRVGLRAPRAELHRSTGSASPFRPSTRRYAVRTSVVTAT